jgi:hypothetical protein
MQLWLNNKCLRRYVDLWHDISSVINSYIFTCILWFYSHNLYYIQFCSGQNLTTVWEIQYKHIWWDLLWNEFMCMPFQDRCHLSPLAESHYSLHSEHTAGAFLLSALKDAYVTIIWCKWMLCFRYEAVSSAFGWHCRPRTKWFRWNGSAAGCIGGISPTKVCVIAS